MLKADNDIFKTLRLAKLLPSTHHAKSLPIDDLAYIWQQCRAQRDRSNVHLLHAHMCHHSLEADTSIGNSLVSMLVDVGSLHDAHWVFNTLPVRHESSWTSLISGYVKADDPHCALSLYDHMQNDDTLRPCGTTYVAALKACTQLKTLQKGCQIHAQVASLGLLERDSFVGSTLLDMYAKCGFIAKAQQVFDDLPIQNVVSWTALIGGYVEHGEGEEALQCYQAMQDKGISPNRITFICSLKACAITGDVTKGQEIHAEVERQGLSGKDIVVGNNLVYMYAKFGMLDIAQEFFDGLPMRNIVSWTSLISGYVEHEHGEEAINCFEEMQVKGIAPNAITLNCVIKACSFMRFIFKGEDIYAEIERQGLLQKDVALGNALVDMYATCGQLAKAQEVFSSISAPNVITWTALISGYVEHGYAEEALKVFDLMRAKDAMPNIITLICSLKACGSIKAADKGRDIQAEIERQGLLERDRLVANALIDMYTKCGLFSIAQQVFDKLSIRDVISWNTLISGYSEHGCGEEALQHCEQMQLEGALPDEVTLVSSFKACGLAGAMSKGRETHVKSAETRLLHEDDIAGSVVVDMYAKLGSISMAKQVFSKLPVRNAWSWTSLIAGYVEHGDGEEALRCFEEMQLSVLSPMAATFVCALKACIIVGSLLKGQEIHAEVLKFGLTENDPTINSCLFFMYARCGSLDSAQQLFDNNLSTQDVVSWSALIEGYAEHELGEEALNCLQRMQHLGIAPNAITLVSSLKACGCIGAVDKGCEIHSEIERQGLIEQSEVLGNTLVSMYAKCGLLNLARQVFDRLPVRDVVSWTTLISGYAQLGQSENAFWAFSEMTRAGIKPSSVSFLVVLSACNRRGLHNISQTYYESMSGDHGIAPTKVHYSCMLDLLNRAGQLDKAITEFQKPLVDSNIVVCRSILSACQHWGTLELANKAFEHVLHMNNKDSASYVLMSRIYAGASSQRDSTLLNSSINAVAAG